MKRTCILARLHYKANDQSGHYWGDYEPELELAIPHGQAFEVDEEDFWSLRSYCIDQKWGLVEIGPAKTGEAFIQEARKAKKKKAEAEAIREKKAKERAAKAKETKKLNKLKRLEALKKELGVT